MSHAQLPAAESPDTPSRRRLLAGVGAVGAVAAVAAVLPATPAADPVAGAAPGAEGPGDAPGGYRLSAHVQRYYQTARV